MARVGQAPRTLGPCEVRSPSLYFDIDLHNLMSHGFLWQVLIVGGGGSGGDGNAPGGGGGGGIVALGNITLVRGTYYVTVGAGGWWDPSSSYYAQAFDKPGFCGKPSVLRTGQLPVMVAHGGAGGNGYSGTRQCVASRLVSCSLPPLQFCPPLSLSPHPPPIRLFVLHGMVVKICWRCCM